MHSMNVFPLAHAYWMDLEYINLYSYKAKKQYFRVVCMCIIIIIMLKHDAMDLSLRFHIVTNVGCLNKSHNQTLSLE